LILVDYFCAACDETFEQMVDAPAPDAVQCECGASATWSPWPVMGRVKQNTVTRGGWQKPEHPGWVDTRELGEGQPIEEYREKRRKIREEIRWKENKNL